jgi:hypothetical protein
VHCYCLEFSGPVDSFEKMQDRCAASASIEPFLERIATNQQTWSSVLLCRVCGQTWVCEYPFSESHGGGAPCYYQAALENPKAWLATAVPLMGALRRDAEDAVFCANLGRELGPEPCRQPDCDKLRISHSVFCRAHHFESVLGRPAPENAVD